MCNHLNFQAECQVRRLTEGDNGPITSYVAEIHIKCADCGQVFGFLGPPAGTRNELPTTSQDGLELRCPIVPGPVPRFGPVFYELPASITGKRHHA